MLRINPREEELVEIAKAKAKAKGKLGKDALQGISDCYDFDSEFAIFENMVKSSGCPMPIFVEQKDSCPDYWKILLNSNDKAQSEG